MGPDFIFPSHYLRTPYLRAEAAPGRPARRPFHEAKPNEVAGGMPQAGRLLFTGQSKTKRSAVRRTFSFAEAYFCLGRILNMPVPQTAHVPFIAGRVPPPLAGISTCCASFISRLSLHFTQ